MSTVGADGPVVSIACRLIVVLEVLPAVSEIVAVTVTFSSPVNLPVLALYHVVPILVKELKSVSEAPVKLTVAPSCTLKPES